MSKANDKEAAGLIGAADDIWQKSRLQTLREVQQFIRISCTYVSGRHEIINRIQELIDAPIVHGVNCRKADHIGNGYLHELDDDAPFDVDGLYYCGRCHMELGHHAKHDEGTSK